MKWNVACGKGSPASAAYHQRTRRRRPSEASVRPETSATAAGFIGARDDCARTDDIIRQVRDHAVRSLQEFDLPDPMDPTTPSVHGGGPPAG